MRKTKTVFLVSGCIRTSRSCVKYFSAKKVDWNEMHIFFATLILRLDFWRFSLPEHLNFALEARKSETFSWPMYYLGNHGVSSEYLSFFFHPAIISCIPIWNYDDIFYFCNQRKHSKAIFVRGFMTLARKIPTTT